MHSPLSRATHTVQLLYVVSGLFITTSTICSCEVTPPGMTTMSVHGTTSTCSFISGVKCPLNASKPSFPKFLRSTPGLLLHTTNNQSFKHLLVIHNSGWIFQLLLPSPSYVCFRNSELPYHNLNWTSNPLHHSI